MVRFGGIAAPIVGVAGALNILSLGVAGALYILPFGVVAVVTVALAATASLLVHRRAPLPPRRTRTPGGNRNASGELAAVCEQGDAGDEAGTGRDVQGT
jgi:hypothetical protein